jgi:hypothetical protein
MTAHDPDMAPDADTEKASVPPLGALRCSDGERERTSAALHVAAGEGRLSLDEVEERLAKIYTARYRHELDAITGDLPSSAEIATGWRPIVTMVRQQLADDVSALTGRGITGVSRRRRLVLAFAVLAMLLFFAAMLMLALHGIAGEAPEQHDFGRG